MGTKEVRRRETIRNDAELVEMKRRMDDSGKQTDELRHGLKVRPLESGEEALWLSVTLSPAETAEKLDWFKGLFKKFEADDPRSFLIAVTEEGECAGRLRGLFLEPKLFSVAKITRREKFDSAEIYSAFGAYLHASFQKDRINVLSWLREEEMDTNRMLEGAGFLLSKTKIFVERELSDVSFGYEDPFTYETLEEIGEDRFLEIMVRAAAGDPFEEDDSADPRIKFEELIKYAGGMYDPGKWFVLRLDGKPAGVLLPQVFERDTSTGTVFYIGVLPEFRGRGLGAVIHSKGLSLLAEEGARMYIGSTDTRNVPMIRIFEKNGCRQTDQQLYYSPSSEQLL